MAALIFYDGHAKRLTDGSYGSNWSAAGLKFALTNTAPTLSHNSLSQITEVSGGNWSAGGMSVGTVSTAIDSTDGARVVTNADFSHVQSSASVGPFRYVVLYADTPTSPTADPLIGYWDYGSSITLLVGETLQVDLDANFALFTVTDAA
jgi:hypothetical protein